MYKYNAAAHIYAYLLCESLILLSGVLLKIIKGMDGFASHYAINIWRNINVALMLQTGAYIQFR